MTAKDFQPVDQDSIWLVVHLAADIVADCRQERVLAELAEIGTGSARSIGLNR